MKYHLRIPGVVLLCVLGASTAAQANPTTKCTITVVNQTEVGITVLKPVKQYLPPQGKFTFAETGDCKLPSPNTLTNKSLQVVTTTSSLRAKQVAFTGKLPLAEQYCGCMTSDGKAGYVIIFEHVATCIPCYPAS